MPELPEVQTIVNDLNNAVLNETIDHCVDYRSSVIVGDLEEFKTKIKQKKILGVTRQGKFIVMCLSGGFSLVVHLRMTGKFVVSSLDSHRHLHDRVIFILRNGKKLIYNDLRCFGTLELLENIEQHKGISVLGWDPWSTELTAENFLKKVKQKNSSIKVVLLDQTIIAGLGNIYVAEILFDARLDPTKLASRLNRPIAERLIVSMKKILELALKCNGTSISDYRRVDDKQGEFQNFLKVYGKAGQICPVCSGKIIKITQNQRSTFLCPTCQKKS